MLNREPSDRFHSTEKQVLQEELFQHNHNLNILREQQAKYGSTNAPLHLLNQIADEERRIDEINTRLSGTTDEPSPATQYFSKGTQALIIGDLGEAQRYYEMVLYYNPFFPRVKEQLALIEKVLREHELRGYTKKSFSSRDYYCMPIRPGFPTIISLLLSFAIVGALVGGLIGVILGIFLGFFEIFILTVMGLISGANVGVAILVWYVIQYLDHDNDVILFRGPLNFLSSIMVGTVVGEFIGIVLAVVLGVFIGLFRALILVVAGFFIGAVVGAVIFVWLVRRLLP